MGPFDEIKARDAGARSQAIMEAALEEIADQFGGQAVVSAIITAAGSLTVASVIGLKPGVLTTEAEKRRLCTEFSKRYAQLFADIMAGYGVPVDINDLSQPPNRN